MKLRHEKGSLWVQIGPWLARFAWNGGFFSNGSRWFSGWHRWQDPATWGEPGIDQ